MTVFPTLAWFSQMLKTTMYYRNQTNRVGNTRSKLKLS